ncbi:Tm-1-like ATP-binding domain-containing protein [Sedimentitalea sp. JM2-8]|uniref:Tm-1-like ATP-binding domain-containing protein n=1 Tax=Sedimentitalea xiamensis TaxID=3050037 RepID=A0ABT7FA96_9RHOB|nr:Tm-1-like ATP-binding domain-containing protein [Sedimentitalea xiamensis]MDK3071958.1 Tm-1-like ATP-binding domain-containing protein [Sedimentitalea xiamensis]
MDRTILLLGTGDTKSDEMQFLADCIKAQGGTVVVMDVGVIGDPTCQVDISRHDVARAARTDNAAIVALGDENKAMTKTSEGAATLARALCEEGRVHGVLILGGTMGTDLALDVCEALPLGFPKVILTTVAFSPLLPPDRISPDVMMVLWAGGLYGLNTVCRMSLSQAAGAVLGAARAAGAVLGAARAAVTAAVGKPTIGMTSLGSASLKYMKRLKPALEARGFELAVFHTTGMGGRAFETLAARGAFACVMDFSLVEVSNDLLGSVVSAGRDRMTAAGAAGIPQIIAPGGVSLIDMRTWAEPPAGLGTREVHAHNRLIACALMNTDEKILAARAIAAKANAAKGATRVVMPMGGIDEWDRPGGPFHDPEGLQAFAKTLRDSTASDRFEIIEAHINDAAFADRVLAILDAWLADGTVARPG